MTAHYMPITIEQGATWSWGFVWHLPQVDAQGEVVLDAEGNPLPGEVRPLTGCKAQMQVRRTVNASTPLIDASTENGMISIDEDEGHVSILLTADTTMGMTVEEGVYDIEVVFPTEVEGGTARCFEGPVTGKLNVTR